MTEPSRTDKLILEIAEYLAMRFEPDGAALDLLHSARINLRLEKERADKYEAWHNAVLSRDELVQRVTKVEAERDEWRVQANTAEIEIDTLKRRIATMSLDRL